MCSQFCMSVLYLEKPMIEQDQDGSIKQQIIAVLMGVAAILTAYAQKLRTRISKQTYSNEFLQNLVKESVARSLIESEHFKSLDRRLQALDYARADDRREIMDSVER